MSQEHEELAQRWVHAYNERDMNALDDLIEPDFEFVPYLAALIETTVYQGLDGLRRYFEDADAAWETIRVRVDEIREIGIDRFVSFGELDGKGRASGLEVHIPLAFVVESRNGRMLRLEAYASKLDALDAAGLTE